MSTDYRSRLEAALRLGGWLPTRTDEWYRGQAEQMDREIGYTALVEALEFIADGIRTSLSCLHGGSDDGGDECEEDDCLYCISNRLARAALAVARGEGAKVVENTAVADDPFFHVWRCSNCGDSQIYSSSPLWRWSGDAWEHKCGGPQDGHYPARDFGAVASGDDSVVKDSLTTACGEEKEEKP